MFIAIARLFWNRSAEAVVLCAVVIVFFVSLYTATFVIALPDMMAATPEYLQRLASTCPSTIACIGRVVFESPGQALGLSGVEAMPFLIPLVFVAIAVKVEQKRIEERVKGVKNILLVASIGMSFLLLTSIWMTATLLTPEMVQAGGEAKDRATSWAMHHYLGEGLGTLGDVSLILMLALASSSVVPVLVNAYPRILGPLGIHPQLLRRKVVITIQTLLCILIVTAYRADVKLMTGSYAVGVMQLLAGLSVAAIVDILLSQLPLRKKIALSVFGGFIIYTSVSVLLLKPEGFQNFGYTLVGVSLFVVIGNIVRAFDRRADGLRAWVNLAFRPDQITNNGDVNLISVAGIPTTIEQITEILRKVYILEGKIPVFLHVSETANMAFEDGLQCELKMVEGYPIITAQAKSWVVVVPLIVHAVHEMGKKVHINFVQSHGASVVAQNYELLYAQPDEDDPKRPVFHGPIY